MNRTILFASVLTAAAGLFTIGASAQIATVLEVQGHKVYGSEGITGEAYLTPVRGEVRRYRDDDDRRRGWDDDDRRRGWNDDDSRRGWDDDDRRRGWNDDDSRRGWDDDHDNHDDDDD